MCGIFGYSGKRPVEKTLLEGLSRLEYRGYDSWGIALLNSETSKLDLVKNIGKIPDFAGYLESKVNAKFDPTETAASLGIAHTRWATHGGVTQVNAHPHFSSDGRFVLAQNGIVENYQEIKRGLQELNYSFISETDTEVIVRLIEEELKNADSDILSATTKAFAKLTGRNTIIILDKLSETIIAIRNGSPLVVGKDKDEWFIGSDYLSFANKCQNILELNNLEGVFIKDNQLTYFRIDSAGEVEKLKPEFHKTETTDVEVDKAGHSNFMIKEILEQPTTVLAATSYSEIDLEILIEAMKKANRIYTVGCGTAAFAAAQIAYYLRKISRLDTVELKGYELDSYKDLFTKNDLLIAISQSGETADTIEAVEFMKSAGGKVASVVNMQGSTITRLSDYKFFSRTGPEICVASTKAFTAQVSWGYLLAKTLTGNYQAAKANLNLASRKLEELLQDDNFKKTIIKVRDYCLKQEHAFVLGRGANFAIALEGALKVKEISYKHFEGFAAGELKHGVIALVGQGTPVFSIVSQDDSEADMLNATAEVKSRGAHCIAISSQDNELFAETILVPDLGELSVLANVIPFQMLAYHLGKSLGNRRR